MTLYCQCMVPKLRNIVHLSRSLLNAHGDSVSFFFSLLPGFCYDDLQIEVANVQASTLSEGTKRNYRSIWSLCDKFTRLYDLKPFPATPETLSSFITLVGFSVKSHKTVHNYISALHKLHDLSSFDSAAFDDISIKLTLKDLEKLKRHIPLCKLPITPDMLLNSVCIWISGTLPISPYGQLCLSTSSPSFELLTYAPNPEKHFPPSPPCHAMTLLSCPGVQQLQSRGLKQDSPGTQLWSFQSLVFQTLIFALSRPYKHYFKQSMFPQCSCLLIYFKGTTA